MATTVYTVEEVELQDETTVTLRPLVVIKLRRFMKMMGEMATSEDEEVIEEIMLNCAAFCLARQRPEFWNDKKKNGTYPNPDATDDNEEPKELERLKGGYTDAFIEVADMPTVTKIIEICGGINFNDPNLLRAAMEAQQAGMTS